MNTLSVKNKKLYFNNPLNGKEFIFTQDTIDSLGELGQVLQKIHRRIKSEGYILKDGIVSKTNLQENENN